MIPKKNKPLQFPIHRMMNQECKSLNLNNQNNLNQDQKTQKTKSANHPPLTQTLKVEVVVKAAQVNPALRVPARKFTKSSPHVDNPQEYPGQQKSKIPANEGSKAHQKVQKAAKVLTACLITLKIKLRYPQKRKKTKKYCLDSLLLNVKIMCKS